MRLLLRSILYLTTLAAPPLMGRAQTGTDTTLINLEGTGGSPTAIRVRMVAPTAPAPWQGVVLVATPAGHPASRGHFLMDTLLKRALDARGMAIVHLRATSPAGDTALAALSTTPANLTTLTGAIGQLGQQAGRPELANGAMIPVGVGRLAPFATALAGALSDRVVAAVLVRPQGYPATTGVPATLPMLVLAGDVAGPDVFGNRAVRLDSLLYVQTLQRRAQGQLVQFANEPNASQSTFGYFTLRHLAGFIDRAAAARIPAGANPTTGPVTLTGLTEAGGFLGRLANVDAYTRSTVETSAVSAGTLPAATSSWLIDGAMADLWRELHIDPFDTAQLSPMSTQGIPYCSGRRPSSVEARVFLGAGQPVGADNRYRVEASDIRGDFDNPIYPARGFGQTRSSSGDMSLIDAVLPDNLQFMTPTPMGSPNRYRFRIVGTNPPRQSRARNEVQIWRLCPLAAPSIYLSTLSPFREVYQPGDTIRFTIFKLPTVNVTANTMQFWLSDTNGVFSDAQMKFDSIPVNFVGNAQQVTLQIPAGVPTGLRYLIRARLSGQPELITVSNGHELYINTQLTRVAAPRARIAPTSLTLWPNPVTGQWVNVRAAAGSIARLEVIDARGRVLPLAYTPGQPVSIGHLSPGVYVVRAYGATDPGMPIGQTRLVRGVGVQ